VLIVYVLSILGALWAPGRSHGHPPPPGVLVKSGEGLPHETLRGFALSLHYTDQLGLYMQAIDEMAALGFNCVEIATPAFQTNGASHDVRVEAGPGRGPHRWQLIQLLGYARERGLVTTLMPQILFTQPRGNEWRGKIHPEHWGPWWENYKKTIDYFLDIANEAGVDIFCVGSELLSTERQVDRWVEMIGHVRKGFKGRLTYSTNWDHYHVPLVWQHLDLIGISGYWDMTQAARHTPPTPQELAQRWRGIREKLLAFAASQDRPILFTEVGYPSLPWALKDPWNYVNDAGIPSAPDAQALGYKAFLLAWEDLLIHQPNPKHLAGVFFYAWDPYNQGGPQDSGYGVRGKPVYDILKDWLATPR